jgi:uncharacterized protein
MPTRFVIERTEDGEYRFRLRAGTEQVMLTSEPFVARDRAYHGVEAARACATADQRFMRRISRSGGAYFVLTTTSGQVIGKSEVFTTAAAAEKGIESVRADAPRAELVDTTA